MKEKDRGFRKISDALKALDQKAPHTIQGDKIQDLLEKGYQGVKEVIGEFQPSEWKNEIKEMKDRLSDEAQDWSENAKEKARDLTSQAEKQFKESPLLWVGGALGLGLVLGLLLNRRRS